MDKKDIAGKIVVVKYGGHAMVDEALKKSFAEDVNYIKSLGGKPVIVHGGGPQISRMLEKLSIKSEFINGMRVTERSVMDVVEMVLCGKVNKEIVSNINLSAKKGVAIGICGKDASFITADKLIVMDENEKKPLDIGWVGKVKKINSAIIHTLIDGGFIPVIAPVAIGENGGTYNVNADVATGSVASSLSASHLIFITDVDGVLDASGELISSIKISKIDDLIKKRVIVKGMIPKINCARKAAASGVKSVRIINGKRKNALLEALFTDKKIGTLVL